MLKEALKYRLSSGDNIHSLESFANIFYEVRQKSKVNWPVTTNIALNIRTHLKGLIWIALLTQHAHPRDLGR